MLKATYGTGCFARPQHRRRPRSPSRNRLLTTIAYQLDGQPDLRARRLDLHRRRRRPVAARRPEDHPPRRRDPRPRRGRRPRPAALPRPGLHRPRRALLGPRRPRRDLRPHPQLRARPSSPAPRSRASPTRPATSPRRCARDWPDAGGHRAPRRRRHDRQRLDAPGPRRHPRRPGRPPEGAARPPPSAPRGLRGCARACIRGRPNSRAPGRSTAGSSRRWTRQRREESYAGWRDAVRRTLTRQGT